MASRGESAVAAPGSAAALTGVGDRSPGRARLARVAVLVLAAILLGCGSSAPPSLSPTIVRGTSSPSLSPAAPPSPSPTITPALAPSASPTSPAPVRSSPLTSGPAAGQAGLPQLDRRTALGLQAAFTVAADRLGVPGAQATVLFASGQEWQGAYGWADVQARRPMTAGDVFDVASITKTFIAADVLELVAEGRLSLSDPLGRWLPHLPDAGAITVRELLSHTSGLADYFENPRLLRALDADRARRWTADELLPYVGKPLFRPGAGWRYSNTNYLVLGIIVAAVEGRPVQAALSARFLGPLGLTHTALQSGTAPAPSSLLGPVAVPYTRNGPAARPVVALGDGSDYLPYTSLATALGTAGGLVSTSSDLARWAAALYGGQVLPSGWLATMLDDAVSRAFHPARDYALGVEHKTLAGLDTVGHSGACSGYRSAMRYLPALGATVVVLVNEDVLDPDAITSRLVAALEASGRAGPERA